MLSSTAIPVTNMSQDTPAEQHNNGALLNKVEELAFPAMHGLQEFLDNVARRGTEHEFPEVLLTQEIDHLMRDLSAAHTLIFPSPVNGRTISMDESEALERLERMHFICAKRAKTTMKVLAPLRRQRVMDHFESPLFNGLGHPSKD